MEIAFDTCVSVIDMKNVRQGHCVELSVISSSERNICPKNVLIIFEKTLERRPVEGVRNVVMPKVLFGITNNLCASELVVLIAKVVATTLS